MKTKEKRLSQRCVVYKIKINESALAKTQKEQLKMLFVEAKWFYNYELRLLKDGLFKDTNPLNIENVIHLDKDKNKVNSILQFLTSSYKQSINKQIISQLKTIKTLKKNGYIKKGDLHFISECKALDLKQYGNTHKFKSLHKIKIQGISKYVKVCGTKQFWNKEGLELANAKLLNTANGYYIALTCYFPKENTENISKQHNQLPDVGIDLGCQTTLTTSDGTKKTILVEETERLKKEQKKLARQQRNSNNYKKTQKKIQKQYENMMNKKEDISNKLVAEFSNKVNHVVIQDEQLHNWHKNGHGKKIQHSCLGRIKSKIKQRCNVIILSKWIPTTKLCRECGQIHEISLHERSFKCNCGVDVDRDIHAAQNMLWVWKDLVGRDTAELTLEDFKTSMSNYQFDASLKDDSRRCSVFS